jgi:hypothetical protein
MGTISCAHELCAADHDEATDEPIRHYRVITDEHDAHRVVARWTGDDPTTARVELTHQDATVTLTPRDAAFWAGVLVSGGVWAPAHGGGAGAMAIDLGIAAEVLSLLDEDGEPPQFGSRHLGMSVDRAVAQIFEDDDSAALIPPRNGGRS